MVQLAKCIIYVCVPYLVVEMTGRVGAAFVVEMPGRVGAAYLIHKIMYVHVY